MPPEDENKVGAGASGTPAGGSAGASGTPGVQPSEDKVVSVPLSMLTKMQEQLADMEKKDADREAQIAGLEQMIDSSKAPGDEPALREKKSFEPKFRTVRLRKYPIAGDWNNQGYVIGWTDRGAYQEVDRTGVTPQVVDFIDVIFLGQEKTAEGKLKAEKVRLLDLMNKSSQVHCKIINTAKEEKKVPTGEEIDVSMFDPQHGLISTGEKVDGYTAFSQITHTIQIPGVTEPVVIDAMFCN